MPIYAQHFTRQNFSINPVLEERVCVIFQTDIPWDDSHIEAFEEVMWDALWKQYPIWKCPYNASKPAPPGKMKWRHGFSSPNTTGRLIKLGKS